jgi:DNA-directed RNA polymerase sigma subunit (sigma70/sigma32)
LPCEDASVADQREKALRRVLEAHDRLERAEGELDEARRAQREALHAARSEGVTLRELAEAIGVTRQRIAQILEET